MVKYIKPEMEIIEFDEVDIICASGDDTGVGASIMMLDEGNSVNDSSTNTDSYPMPDPAK